MNSPIAIPMDVGYQHPSQKEWAGWDAITTAAAKVARAKTRETTSRAEADLRNVMDDLDMGALNRWAFVHLIDSSWNAGAGASRRFWTKATNAINRTAREVLKERPMFELLEDQGSANLDTVKEDERNTLRRTMAETLSQTPAPPSRQDIGIER